MPWNFFITPANYWELKLGTSSESVADSFGGNFSSLEVSNNTGMYFEKNMASLFRSNFRSTRTFGSRLGSLPSKRFILVQNCSSSNKQAFEFNVR